MRTTVVCLKVLFLIVKLSIDILGYTAVFVTRISPRKLNLLNVLISFRAEVVPLNMIISLRYNHPLRLSMTALPSQIAQPLFALKQGLVLNECLLKSGLQSIYIRIIWSMAFSIDSCAQIQSNYIYFWQVGPRNLYFNKLPS